jgi:tRNA G46 methylase TrmB
MHGTAEAYGLTFRFPALDTAVGASLRDHGEFARPEIDFISAACAGDLIDVGANIGAICLPFARDNPSSQVVAIEAHPGVAALLRWNVTANDLTNVTVLDAVAGEVSRQPANPCRAAR